MAIEENPPGSNSQPNYPDPAQSSSTPYPAAQQTPYGPLPGSSQAAFPTPSPYGAFPGSSSYTYGPFPGSQAPQPVGDHHITDFAALTDLASPNEPAHLAPRHVNNAFPTPNFEITETQRLAQQFHVRHGDPGSRMTGGESRSALAGLWAEDVGGKAVQRAAYRASVTYGGTYEYDAEYDAYEDPGEELFAAADLVHMGGAPTRGGIKRGRGRGGWKRLLKGTSHEDVGKSSPRQRGRGGGRGRGRGGRRKAVDPGPAFRSVMAKANAKNLESNFDEALDLARQAMMINPEVFVAHSLISECLKAQGKLGESVDALIFGAETIREPQTHCMVADRILEFAGEERTTVRLKQAIEHYAQALKYVKDDQELEFKIRSWKLDIHEEADDSKGARLECKSILKLYPRKTYYLRRYAYLCDEWLDRSELGRAKETYDRAFDLYKDDEVFQDEEEDETDQWSHLNIYLELVQHMGLAWEGIATCKRLSRRFLGRQEESFWDRYTDDDREFDEDNERRNLVGEWQMGRASRDLGRYWLPIEIRVRLGLLRIKCGVHCHEEALRHFRPLLRLVDYMEDYFDTFMAVASALREERYFKEAAEFYDCVRTVAGPNDDIDKVLDDRRWMKIATCYQAADRIEDAIAGYEVIRARKGDGYTKACAKLARIYEDGNELDKARFLCNELIMLNRRDLLMDAGVKMVPPPSKTAPPIKILKLDPNKAPKPVTPRPVVPLREIRPNAEISGPAGQTANSIFHPGGPVSAPVVLPPEPPSSDQPSPEQPKKRKRGGRKKKGILQTIVGDFNDPELADEVEPTPKRPRLKKPLKPKAPSKLMLRYREIQDAESRTHANYSTIEKHWQALKEGKDEDAIEQWVEAANNMMEDFTSMKVFFPERDKNQMLKENNTPGRPFLREQGPIPKDPSTVSAPGSYLNLPLSEWHHVFSDLALLYASSGEQDKCFTILRDILFGANPFFTNQEIHWASYGVAIYCGMSFNDTEYLIILARKIISDNFFRGGWAFQLLAAVCRFAYGNNWFSSGPSQKFMLRMVKQFDYMVMTDEVRDQVDWSIQKNGMGERAKKLADETHELDPGILMTYGHMVAVANHSHSSLPYYYRALALQPDNWCVNLSIAAMWVQNSMKRQTENRQFGITQGLAFLYRYYDIRTASGKACHKQEAEYNVGRMWHYLGLTHLALPAYERVLELSAAMQKERLESGEEPLEVDGEDYATEAAFALQSIYALGGDSESARKVTEEWLVI